MAQDDQTVSCVLGDDGTVTLRFPDGRTRFVAAQIVCRSTVVAEVIDLEGVGDAKIFVPAAVVSAWLDCADATTREHGLHSVPSDTLVDYLQVRYLLCTICYNLHNQH
jgi:hypothetical protein